MKLRGGGDVTKKILRAQRCVTRSDFGAPGVLVGGRLRVEEKGWRREDEGRGGGRAQAGEAHRPKTVRI